MPFGFQLNGAAMVLDSRITEAEATDGRLPGGHEDSQTNFDLSGHFLPRSPVLTLNYGVSQRIYTSFGMFDWMLKAQTKTKQYLTVFNGEGSDLRGNPEPLFWDMVDGYTMVDAAVGYTHPNGRLRLEVLGTNLTDVAYMTSLISNPGQNTRFFNAPRQLAVRMTVSL